MSSDTPDLKESRYISAVMEDFFGDNYHIECDQEVLKSLEEDANKKLADPQSTDDYLNLVKLILEKHPNIILAHRPVHMYLNRFKAKYVNNNGDTGPAWEDFKRLVAICLRAGRFETIRLLGTTW